MILVLTLLDNAIQSGDLQLFFPLDASVIPLSTGRTFCIQEGGFFRKHLEEKFLEARKTDTHQITPRAKRCLT